MKITLALPVLPVIAAILAAGISPTKAATIGLNFVNNTNAGVQDGATDSLGAAESAGSAGFAQTNWNNLGRWGNPTALKDNTGSATGVSTSWDATGVWTSGVGTSTSDHKLMSGYLDSNSNVNDVTFTSVFSSGNNKPLLYFSGVSNWLATQGATSFTLVLYVDGDSADGSRTGEYWAQNVTGTNTAFTLGADITPHIFNKDSANFAGTYAQVDSSATSSATAGTGNYIVFTGLTADTFLVRTADNTRAPINGVQLIAVPEASTALLGGLGLLGLLSRRRRR